MRISPELYNDEYFLSECDGYQEFLMGGGTHSPERLRVIWHFADIAPGMTILDAGCGRGELLNKCKCEDIFSVGVDYSKHALRLARSFLISNTEDEGKLIILIQSDIKRLPLVNNLFDRVIMSDVIEHIDPASVLDVLLEVRRVLRVNGKLIIHTMPNLWYYRFGYPLYRFVELIRGNKLPLNPRDRYKFSHFHVNEQTPRSLKALLKKAGFKSKVWLHDYRSYSEYPAFMSLGMKFVSRSPLVKTIFCDDIFAVATKTND